VLFGKRGLNSTPKSRGRGRNLLQRIWRAL
jgi:hypothetical protein